uniref:Col_cuticle_N domain-containing protein n=2 Tax=Onchocerca ochengi TaxID=42157 RepID=A0A182END7_ONCOC
MYYEVIIRRLYDRRVFYGTIGMTVAHSAAYSAIALSLLSFVICIYSLKGLASRINAINAKIVEETMEFRGMENFI